MEPKTCIQGLELKDPINAPFTNFLENPSIESILIIFKYSIAALLDNYYSLIAVILLAIVTLIALNIGLYRHFKSVFDSREKMSVFEKNLYKIAEARWRKQ
jgi:hypothetical protein